MKKHFMNDLAIKNLVKKKAYAIEDVIDRHQFDKLVICPNFQIS